MRNFNCSVRAHSRHHLELKSEYPLIKDSGKTRYRMDLYFFFPNQLNITEKHFGVRKFIDNIKIYTRFSTPSMSLPMLTDSQNPLNPVSRIRQYLNSPERLYSHRRDLPIYELRVLTNVYRSELENTAELIAEEIQKQNRDTLCRKRIERLLSDIQAFLKEFRKLHSQFISPRITPAQRTALGWADESISISTERILNRLFSYAEKIEEPEDLLIKMEAVTKKESGYRRQMNYQYLYNDEDPYLGEKLAYRENILKKWAHSALYMTREDRKGSLRAGHFLGGAAAGIAMIFAVLVTIYAGKVFIPNTTPWVLAIVVSYIFKDRIKEILKEYFKKLMPRITADQHSRLYDPFAEERVGSARAYARFINIADAPGNIQQLWNLEPNPFRSVLPEEQLIHYQRITELNSRKLNDNHTRLNSTTEIIRFQIADWLREMDDPKDVFYRLENMKKIKIKGSRVYRVHLILSLRNDELLDSEEIIQYNIILNRAGIIRIEDSSN